MVISNSLSINKEYLEKEGFAPLIELLKATFEDWHKAGVMTKVIDISGGIRKNYKGNECLVINIDIEEKKGE